MDSWGIVEWLVAALCSVLSAFAAFAFAAIKSNLDSIKEQCEKDHKALCNKIDLLESKVNSKPNLDLMMAEIEKHTAYLKAVQDLTSTTVEKLTDQQSKQARMLTDVAIQQARTSTNN